MAKLKVFISYDYDHDKEYKNLLLAWNANGVFDFSFYDLSVDIAVDRDDAAVTRRVISARINASTYFLCLIGKDTYKSGWVTWEIEKAVELDKKLVAVKIEQEQDYTLPPAILGVGASWAMSFTFDSIKNAIDQEAPT